MIQFLTIILRLVQSSEFRVQRFLYTSKNPPFSFNSEPGTLNAEPNIGQNQGIDDIIF